MHKNGSWRTGCKASGWRRIATHRTRRIATHGPRQTVTASSRTGPSRRTGRPFRGTAAQVMTNGTGAAEQVVMAGMSEAMPPAVEMTGLVGSWAWPNWPNPAPTSPSPTQAGPSAAPAPCSRRWAAASIWRPTPSAPRCRPAKGTRPALGTGASPLWATLPTWAPALPKWRPMASTAPTPSAPSAANGCPAWASYRAAPNSLPAVSAWAAPPRPACG